MGKRVLVTGATGFLGSHLVEALAKQGEEVVYLLRDIASESQFWPMRDRLGVELKAVFGPLVDPRFVARVIGDYEVDTVYHLAAQTQVSTAVQNPSDTFATNTIGTLAVLDACRNMKVHRLVVASTDKVYGNGPIPYVEENPLVERTPYGASKVCADVLAQTYINSYGMSIGITRCGNLFGPGHMNFSTLIPGTIKRVHNNERPVVRFGGHATRDFLYVSDAVRAYLALGASDKVGAFNFSGGTPREIIDIVNLIIEKMGGGIKPIIQPGGVGEIEKQWLSYAKAERELGWKPQTSFEAGLDTTIQWYTDYFKGSQKGVA